MKTSPFDFINIGARRMILTVGSKQIIRTVDLGNNLFTDMYAEFVANLGKPDINISPAFFKQKHFIMHYVLSADSCPDSLSPLEAQPIRLTIELEKPLEQGVTAVIYLHQQKIIEISKDRTVSIK